MNLLVDGEYDNTSFTVNLSTNVDTTLYLIALLHNGTSVYSKVELYKEEFGISLISESEYQFKMYDGGSV